MVCARVACSAGCTSTLGWDCTAWNKTNRLHSRPHRSRRRRSRLQSHRSPCFHMHLHSQDGVILPWSRGLFIRPVATVMLTHSNEHFHSCRCSASLQHPVVVTLPTLPLLRLDPHPQSRHIVNKSLHWFCTHLPRNHHRRSHRRLQGLSPGRGLQGGPHRRPSKRPGPCRRRRRRQTCPSTVARLVQHKQDSLSTEEDSTSCD
jgi:hypothetical protein